MANDPQVCRPEAGVTIRKRLKITVGEDSKRVGDFRERLRRSPPIAAQAAFPAGT
ncbi:MAG TPA: hypothetical protein VF427_15890 [Noviherbaspirillum sp.]